MRRYYLAAGALLLGTSALAWAGDADKKSFEPIPVTSEAKTDTGWDKSVFAAKSAASTAGDAKLELASLDKDLEKLAIAETDAKVLTASADMPSDKVQTAWADTDAKVETASVDKVETTDTGMGGPFETADLTPRPATQNYPPCDPGPGDDSCIQLYEPGVRAQLASWNRPTGGLADGQSMTAMGGPYEPVGEDSTELAMNGDGVVDDAKGEAADLEVQTVAVEPDAAVVAHTEPQGVGGPVEAQSGYPPCDPGPGDDRCIQLYEPGVTGAGN